MQALRRASNVSEAVEILGDVSSDSEAGSDSDGGGDGFYDASESLPEGMVAAGQGVLRSLADPGCQLHPWLGPVPGMLARDSWLWKHLCLLLVLSWAGLAASLTHRLLCTDVAYR